MTTNGWSECDSDAPTFMNDSLADKARQMPCGEGWFPFPDDLSCDLAASDCHQIRRDEPPLGAASADALVCNRGVAANDRASSDVDPRNIAPASPTGDGAHVQPLSFSASNTAGGSVDKRKQTSHQEEQPLPEPQASPQDAQKRPWSDTAPEGQHKPKRARAKKPTLSEQQRTASDMLRRMNQLNACQERIVASNIQSAWQAQRLAPAMPPTLHVPPQSPGWPRPMNAPPPSAAPALVLNPSVASQSLNLQPNELFHSLVADGQAHEASHEASHEATHAHGPLVSPPSPFLSPSRPPSLPPPPTSPTVAAVPDVSPLGEVTTEQHQALREGFVQTSRSFNASTIDRDCSAYALSDAITRERYVARAREAARLFCIVLMRLGAKEANQAPDLYLKRQPWLVVFNQRLAFHLSSGAWTCTVRTLRRLVRHIHMRLVAKHATVLFGAVAELYIALCHDLSGLAHGHATHSPNRERGAVKEDELRFSPERIEKYALHLLRRYCDKKLAGTSHSFGAVCRAREVPTRMSALASLIDLIHDPVLHQALRDARLHVEMVRLSHAAATAVPAWTHSPGLDYTPLPLHKFADLTTPLHKKPSHGPEIYAQWSPSAHADEGL